MSLAIWFSLLLDRPGVEESHLWPGLQCFFLLQVLVSILLGNVWSLIREQWVGWKETYEKQRVKES